MRVFVVGATGYIGKHVVCELVKRGHDVVCFARGSAGVGGAETRFGDVTDSQSIARDGFRGEKFDVVVSCLATRTGAANDAWKIEHRANLDVLEASKEAGVRHFVLLSAICVQKPRLEFQKAKLAFERALIESGTTYSIVRPTAFFKSLSGQVEAVKRGKPFLVFGNGELTACRPISERDLASFIADCLEDREKQNVILPIGGPGRAITPIEQGKLLCNLSGHPARYRRVPVAMLNAIIFVLAILGKLIPKARDLAEFARIGRYYATESMLVWNEASAQYDSDSTPSFGSDTLSDFYARVIREGLAGQELGDHAIRALKAKHLSKIESCARVSSHDLPA